MPPPRYNIKGFACGFENCHYAAGGLAAFENDIDVTRIKLDPETAPAYGMCGYES